MEARSQSTAAVALMSLVTTGTSHKMSTQNTVVNESDLLCTDNILAHYDLFLELGISCDASEVEIGAFTAILMAV